jgi:hypothetical protein
MSLDALKLLSQPRRPFPRMMGQPGERGIEPLEEATSRAHLHRRIGIRAPNQAVVIEEATGLREHRHPLRAVLVQGRHALLLEGLTRDRIQCSRVYADQPFPLEFLPESSERRQVLFGRPVTADRLVEPTGQPSLQTQPPELRE